MISSEELVKNGPDDGQRAVRRQRALSLSTSYTIAKSSTPSGLSYSPFNARHGCRGHGHECLKSSGITADLLACRMIQTSLHGNGSTHEKESRYMVHMVTSCCKC